MNAQPVPSNNAEWFATQVRVGREHLCARHLQVRGYEVFLPCYRQERRWSDRVKHACRPLFSGYVFCRVTSDVVGKIVTTPGVLRIVGDGRRALPVSAGEIETIQRIVSGGVTVEPWPWTTGQRVRIEHGPLRGAEGVVVKTGGRDRVVVSISLLRRSIAVELDARWVGLREESSTDRCRLDATTASPS